MDNNNNTLFYVVKNMPIDNETLGMEHTVPVSVLPVHISCYTIVAVRGNHLKLRFDH